MLTERFQKLKLIISKAQLEQTKSTFESQQQAQLASLTKHDITGVMLQAGGQSYFAPNDAQDRHDDPLKHINGRQ